MSCIDEHKLKQLILSHRFKGNTSIKQGYHMPTIYSQIISPKPEPGWVETLYVPKDMLQSKLSSYNIFICLDITRHKLFFLCYVLVL